MATYNIISHAGSGRCLNIASSSSITNGTNVNVYAATGSNDQKWVIDSLTSAQEQYIKHFSNQAYALNAYRVGTNWNCTLYKAAGNADGSLIITKVSTGVYTIRLSKHSNRYLTAEGNTNSANVSWQAYTGAANQQWKISAVSAPTYKSQYSTFSYSGLTLHIMKTSPSNIVLVNIKRTAVKNSNRYGINGGFFTTAGSDYTFYNIATNNGVSVGPNGSGDANGSGGSSKVGNAALAYHNGKLKMIDDVIRATEAQGALGSPTAVWIQGGINMHFGNTNWSSSENWYFDYGVSSTRTGRTAMVANTKTNELYLIIATSSSGKSITTFRNAMKSYFGFSDSNNGSSDYAGLMLDGGASSSMRAMVNGTAKSFGGARAINEMISLKEP